MRILLVSYEYPPVGAGAATAGRAMAKALVELGHRVVVLTTRFKGLPPRSQDQGIIIHRVPSLRRRIDRSDMVEMASFLAAGLMFVPTILRTHQVEGAIVFFSMPCGPIGLLSRWIGGVPYIISLRGGDVPGTEPSLNFLHRFLSPIRRAVLKNSIAIVANSNGLRKMAETADPFPVQVIPNGVDTGFFVPPHSKPARNDTVLRILFVGRFRQQKNLPFLFRQVAQLPSAGFELHLVGDGPEKERLEELARKLGIFSAITWHGWLSPAALLPLYHFTRGCPTLFWKAWPAGSRSSSAKFPATRSSYWIAMPVFCSIFENQPHWFQLSPNCAMQAFVGEWELPRVTGRRNFVRGTMWHGSTQNSFLGVSLPPNERGNRHS